VRLTRLRRTMGVFYTHHKNMLVHNGLAAVIYGKSLIYGKYFTFITFTSGHNHTARI